MHLDVAARILKELARLGRLSSLPQLPPSVASHLEEDAAVLAAALERLPAPIRSGMAATLLEIGERENLLVEPEPTPPPFPEVPSTVDEVSPHVEEDEEEDVEASGEAFLPTTDPKIVVLPRPQYVDFHPFRSPIPGVGIVPFDIHAARSVLTRIIPYGAFVTLSTNPGPDADSTSAVMKTSEAPNWPPIPIGDRGTGIVIFENDAIVVKAHTDDEVFNSFAADMLLASTGDNVVVFFVPGCSRFTAVMRKTHPSVARFFAEVRRGDERLLTVGHPGTEPIPVSGRAPNGRPLCRFMRSASKNGGLPLTEDDLRRYLAELRRRFDDTTVLPESATAVVVRTGTNRVARPLPADDWAYETLSRYGVPPFDRFASAHLPYNDPRLLEAVDRLY